MSKLGDSLNDCLADAAVFYFRVHAAHWNVIGDDFPQFHEFFGEIYEDVWGSLDGYGESLRRLGEFPISSLAELAQKAALKGNSGVKTDDQELLTELISMNDKVLECIGEAYDASQKQNEQGIANFLADRDDMHKKWRWQMTASLEAESDATEQMDSPKRGGATPKNTVPKADPRKFSKVAPVVARPPKVK